MLLKNLIKAILLLGLVYVIGVPLATPIGYQVLIGKTLRERAEEIQAKLPRVLDDQTYINQNFPLLEKNASTDAGPFLNPLLKWIGRPTDGEGSGQYFGEIIAKYRKNFPMPESNPILLSDKPRALDSLETLADWKKVDIQGLDFHWMKELSQFDFWDISENSPNALDYHRNSLDSILNHYEPVSVQLLSWAALRLAQGIQEQDLVSAHQEVQHLVQLMLSTEDHLMSPLAMMILKTEAKLYDTLINEKAPFAQGWQPTSKETLSRVSRYLEQSPFFLNPAVSEEVFQSVVTGDRSIGVCLSLSSSLTFYLHSLPYLHHRYKESYQILEEALSKSKNCRLNRFREAFRSIAEGQGDVSQGKKEPSELVKDVLSDLNKKYPSLIILWPNVKSKILEYELFRSFFVNF